MASQIETWVREIHADVREMRGELTDIHKEVGGLRTDVAKAETLEVRITNLESNEERRSQRAIAFSAPFFAAVIGGLIAVAPHIP